ncbi:hypothetical protein [Gorillibacterium sp. CAU 1737]|uniref:hypothetical protein n=1 Tax=Gorillibacterium sp. CAU 1737 TaxID=3140362 RepID=UPI00325FF5AD
MSDKDQYQEIWVTNEPDEQTVVALLNGEYGWLMYLREEGDAGFSSRNPDYAGPEEATMEFFLSNGQCDEYPMAWVLPVERVYAAIEYFKIHHKPPAFIVWHNDSNDGVSLNEEPSTNR